MMAAAQRDRELVADFAAERTALGETQVMSVTGYATAGQTRLLSDVLDVLAVTNPAGLRDGQNALVDCCGPPRQRCPPA